ncbi:MAG: Beta-barrel assembly-enhancing protease [Candidatus Udaeobacter sp.]|nr:MAG: Beta-barrel assembly-enhancing protease [Candidatus Udaeobacter sp.]
MAARRLSARAMKERQVSNRRKHSSGASGSDSCVRGRRAKPRVTDLLVCLGLVAITWAVFGQTLTHDFVNFDDHVYVYENPLVVRGLSTEGIIGAFTHTHALNWHPLTTLSHMLDCQLYGLKAGGHHLTNVILHTISVLLLFLVFKQMTGGLWQSAFVAALFAIHPLHVESVAWIAERKDVLSAVFFMLTLAAYARYARAPSPARYLLVAVLFAFGLMSKPMLVTLPFVLLLLDYWPLGRLGGQKSEVGSRLRRLITEKIPLFALSALSCAATLLTQRQGPNAIDQLPFLWRLNNTFVSYVTYIWQMLWPVRLAVFYPHPNDRLSVVEVTVAIAFLVGVSLLVLYLRRTKPYLVTGWFWYLGMLVPVIGLVQVGEQAHADRYTYLPQIGLYIMIAWAVGDLLLESPSRVRRAVVGVAAAIAIVCLGMRAFVQVSYWKNSQTLWSHTLAVTGDNDVAHNNLGFLFLRRGELDNAISEFQAALDIRSRNTETHYSLGAALIQNNLGNAFARKQLSDEAINHLQEAVRLRPDYADAYFNLGSVLFQQGRIDQAIAQWQKALAIRPRDAEAHRNLASALRKQGNVKGAIAEYEQALNITPEDRVALNNLAWILATSSDASMRDGARAVTLGVKAVQASEGKDPNFVRTLAAARAEAGQFAEAVATAETAKALASTQNKPELASRLQEEIALYRARLALRE